MSERYSWFAIYYKSKSEGEITFIARRRVSEFMAVVKRRADADMATFRMVLPCYKAQLNLKLICVRIARVRRLKDGPGVASAGHEHLGGVVDLREL